MCRGRDRATWARLPVTEGESSLARVEVDDASGTGVAFFFGRLSDITLVRGLGSFGSFGCGLSLFAFVSDDRIRITSGELTASGFAVGTFLEQDEAKPLFVVGLDLAFAVDLEISAHDGGPYERVAIGSDAHVPERARHAR